MKGEDDARQATERQERATVRSSQGQGDVQEASGADRQLAGGFEPRWQEVRFGRQLQAGRDDRAEEGGRAQGRQGLGAEEVVVASSVVLAVCILGAHQRGAEAGRARALVVSARRAKLGRWPQLGVQSSGIWLPTGGSGCSSLTISGRSVTGRAVSEGSAPGSGA